MGLKKFGIYFAEAREKSGYRSQRELADASGVSHSTINRIEAGTHKVSPETLKLLAEYLKDVSYYDLMKQAGYIDEPDELDIEYSSENKTNRDLMDTVKEIEDVASLYKTSVSDPAFREVLHKAIEFVRAARKNDGQ